MSNSVRYEQFPLKLVCLSALTTVIGYLLGTIVFYLLNPWLGAAFLLLCLAAVIVVMRYRCSYCYYYGKRCSSGFSLVASKLFKKRSPEEFATQKTLMPAMLISLPVILLPLLAAIALVLLTGTLLAWALLAANLLMFVPGSAKKSLYCSHCKQRELGCPACDGLKPKSPADLKVPREAPQ